MTEALAMVGGGAIVIVSVVAIWRCAMVVMRARHDNMALWTARKHLRESAKALRNCPMPDD